MMANSSANEYEFECPQCGEQFEVNDGMRDTLLEHGCPVCTASVSTAAFSPVVS